MEYNTLGAPYKTTSPDEGESNYFFDEYGRIVASQNAKQARTNSSNGKQKFSYSTYDIYGRVFESGELETTQYDHNTIETIVKDNTQLNGWIAASSRYDYTRSYYDKTYSITENELATYGNNEKGSERNALVFVAQYNRVLSPTYESPFVHYDNAIRYVYDDQGRLITHISHNPKEGDPLWSLKTTNYHFNTFSGLMEEIVFQPNKQDQHITKFEYDQNQRLTRTYSSSDGVIYTLDEKNLYHIHGPLYRKEIGDHQIQGVDVATTLQGGIKAINSTTLNARRDIGRDGVMLNYDIYDVNQQAKQNGAFARDVAGFGLRYFDGDYTAIGANIVNQSNFMADASLATAIKSEEKNFYNGLISSSVTSIRNPNTLEVLPQYSVYNYDNMNRLREMITFQSDNVLSSNSWTEAAMHNNGVITTDKTKSINYVKIDYDANTNITFLRRNDGNGDVQDYMTYNYEYNTSGLNGNQLQSLTCDVTNGHKDNIGYKRKQIMAGKSFYYNEIGQIEDDLNEGIKIEWNSKRKVKSITHTKEELKGDNVEFLYNPLGIRIGKIIKPRPGQGVNNTAPFVEAPSESWEYIYYALDASGQTFATYNRKKNNQNTWETTLKETMLIASRRLGIKRHDAIMETNYEHPTQGLFKKVIGKKQFEFNNWLGSVISVFRDIKFVQSETAEPQTTNITFDGHDGDVFYTQNPYIKGLIASGEGVNGTDAILLDIANERWGPTVLRKVESGDVISNYSVMAKSIDENSDGFGALLKRCLVTINADGSRSLLYTSPNGTQYLPADWSAVNLGVNTINYVKLEFSADLVVPQVLYREDPQNAGQYILADMNNVHFFGFTSLTTNNANPGPTYFDDFTFTITRGNEAQYFMPVIDQSTDYFPYGLELSGRSFQGNYRYGYQGSEKNPELDGSYTTEFRQLNAALGRWMTTDPVFQPWQSPYNSMDGNPINFNDPLGLDPGKEVKGKNKTYSSESLDGEAAKGAAGLDMTAQDEFGGGLAHDNGDGTFTTFTTNDDGSKTYWILSPQEQKTESESVDPLGAFAPTTEVKEKWDAIDAEYEKSRQEYYKQSANDGAEFMKLYNYVAYERIHNGPAMKSAGVMAFAKGSMGGFSATAETGTISKYENDVSTYASISLSIKFASLDVSSFEQLKNNPGKLGEFFKNNLKNVTFKAFGTSTSLNAAGGGSLHMSFKRESEVDKVSYEVNDNLSIEAYFDNNVSAQLGVFQGSYSSTTGKVTLGVGRSTGKEPVKGGSQITIKLKYKTKPIWLKL